MIFPEIGAEVDGTVIVMIVETEPDGALRTVSGKKGADFWYERNGKKRFFYPLNGAQFADWSASTTEEACANGLGLNYSTRRMRVDGIPFGAPICLITHKGLRGVLRLTEFDPKTSGLMIHWVTWEK